MPLSSAGNLAGVDYVGFVECVGGIWSSTGCAVLACPPSCGHWLQVRPDGDGMAITIVDGVHARLALTVCQDVDFDAICGGSPGELLTTGCGTVSLDDGQWYWPEALYAFPGGPRATLDACGEYAFATIGGFILTN